MRTDHGSRCVRWQNKTKPVRAAFVMCQHSSLSPKQPNDVFSAVFMLFAFTVFCWFVFGLLGCNNYVWLDGTRADADRVRASLLSA